MNNFNNILTKTESLTTLQGGIGNSESGGGGGGICSTLSSYILLRFLQEKIVKFHRKKGGRGLLRPPLNQPMHYLHWNIIFFHHLRAVKDPVWQFTGKVWLTIWLIQQLSMWNGNLFSICQSYPGNYYKVDFASATWKIFLLNDRKQVFGWLSLNPEMISVQI